jgi:hypothetical protein
MTEFGSFGVLAVLKKRLIGGEANNLQSALLSIRLSIGPAQVIAGFLTAAALIMSRIWPTLLHVFHAKVVSYRTALVPCCSIGTEAFEASRSHYLSFRPGKGAQRENYWREPLEIGWILSGDEVERSSHFGALEPTACRPWQERVTGVNHTSWHLLCGTRTLVHAIQCALSIAVHESVKGSSPFSSNLPQ